MKRGFEWKTCYELGITRICMINDSCVEEMKIKVSMKAIGREFVQQSGILLGKICQRVTSFFHLEHGEIRLIRLYGCSVT